MNRSGDKGSRHVDYVIIDVFLLNLVFLAAYFIEFGTRRIPYTIERWRNIAIVMTLLDVLIVLFMDHEPDGRNRFFRELFSVLEQVIILEMLTTFYLYATYSGIKYSRTVIFLSGIFLIPLDTAARLLWDRVKGRRIPKKRVSCAVVGSEALRNNLIAALEETRSSWQVRARMGMNRAGLKTLERLLEENSLDHAILLQEQEEQVFEDAISLCEKYGCRISVVPAFQAAMSPSACVKQIGDIRLLEFRVSPLDHPVHAFIKRLCDIVGSVLLLILFSPVMLAAAIGTKLSSPGPVLFRQSRVGRHRKPFTMLKFRSMRVTDTENTGWTSDRDPRKTRFGSLIRKFSIDELPQLWNVLMGDMSLVGPRPEVPYHVAHFKEEIHSYLVRQQVKPGMTGWAQVHGLRGDTSIQDRISYDIWYIENWSLGLDLEILVRTAFGGMINREKL